MGQRPAITLLNPISSGMASIFATVASPQERGSHSALCFKRKPQAEWLSIFREMQKKEEEGDRKAEKREKKRKRGSHLRGKREREKDVRDKEGKVQHSQGGTALKRGGGGRRDR